MEKLSLPQLILKGKERLDSILFQELTYGLYFWYLLKLQNCRTKEHVS